jgi:SWI/SNF-related matrix-associated actin-dependent regulator of chromatin subfamily A protein 2/4
MQPDDLEEGEIAMSGDSHMDLQQSGSWNHERDDGEDEQVLQPKIKRKRSIRIRPRPNAEKQEDKSGGEGVFPQRGTHLPFLGDGGYIIHYLGLTYMPVLLLIQPPGSKMQFLL